MWGHSGKWSTDTEGMQGCTEPVPAEQSCEMLTQRWPASAETRGTVAKNNHLRFDITINIYPIKYQHSDVKYTSLIKLRLKTFYFNYISLDSEKYLRISYTTSH